MKKKMIAAILACTMAMTTMPSVAFAGADYEAAYNQAHEQAETAYTDWQNAVSDAAAKKSIYDQAVADYNAAVNAVEPTYQEMLKKQRLLDLRTREAIEYYAKQAWSADWGNTSNMGIRADTEERINYLLSQSYSGNVNTLKNYFITNANNDMGWFTPGKSLRMNVTNIKCIPQGITTSTSGNDDTKSIDLLTRYVYFNQRYDMLMLNLDYFDEMNQLRAMEGKSPLLVSPYLMLQSTVNAPLNKYGHNVLAKVGYPGSTCGQNLGSRWGELGATNNNNSLLKDPFMGLYWAEKSTSGGHYENIVVIPYTHAGMACSRLASGSGVPSAGFGEIFEQDFEKMPGKTGPSVDAYRKNINTYVSQELNNYKSAKAAYDNANKNVETKNAAKKNALYDYTDANALASTKKTEYDNAAAAEQAAYDAWQNSINSVSGNEGGNDNPSNPVTDPGTNPGQTVTSVGDVTGLTVSGHKDGNEYIITVSWAAATNANAYEVYEKVGSGAYAFKTTTSSRSVQFTTTSANTTFKYQVRGIYENSGTVIKGGVTTSSVYTTPAAENQPANLAKVTNVKIKQTGWNDLTQTNSVRVSWGAVANAKRYNVYKSINGGNFELADIVGSDTLGLTINTVPYGGTIRCKIAAEDANGNEGPMSDVATLRTSDGSIDIDFNTDPGEQTQPTKPTQPSNPGEQTQPTKPTKPAPVYAKSYVKSFKVVKGKKSFTAKWQKQSKANQKKFKAYQIRYSTKKSMKGAKYVTVKKSAQSKKIKRLKAKKTYYVQARTYKVTGGKKVYSKWTKIKIVKTK